MQYIHDDLSQGSLSSSSSTYSSASSSGIVDDTSSTEYTLNQVLSNPKLLCAFECFLRQSWSHENLLFIEALTQLKHEADPKAVESSLYRIYKTFLARGSPLELNVTTQNQVREDLRAIEWAILHKSDAINILKETERQVIEMLKSKLSSFLKSMDFSTGSISPTLIQSQQVSVVIIGGGFTGFTVASILDQMPRFYVTLIDTKDSFEYTPGIVKKIINPEQTSSLRVRHDAYVKNGRVIIGYAENLANEGKTITVNGQVLRFDYLVIATGSSYSSQLKSTDTSSLYRMNGLEESYLQLLNARKILIIGGGLVGCELASEISQHRFPGAHPKKEVTLVDSHSSVVHRSDPRQQNVAYNYLQNLNVNVVLNERIVDFDSASDQVYHGSSGRTYGGYDKVFIATGTRPNSSLFTLNTSDHTLEHSVDAWGRIKVKPTLQLQHYKYSHIFAGGDVTNVVEEKTGYAATISGVCIARNICRIVKGKAPLKQGTKGTLPAPHKPLHGILEQGGIGKQNLNSIKKKFSFLNPNWAALKYFDEQQFLRIVQGQGSINSSHVLGRLPRKLDLPHERQHARTKSQGISLHSSSSTKTIHRQPSTPAVSRPRSTSQSQRTMRVDSMRSSESSTLNPNHQRHKPHVVRSQSTSTMSTTETDSTKTLKALEGILFEHFTYGGEDIQLFSSKNSTASTPGSEKSRVVPIPEMAYDSHFQLSPPPATHRRRGSLTSSFEAMTCYDKPTVKLTRSASFSSIIQNI